MSTRTLKTELDRGDLNILGKLLNILGLGTVLDALATLGAGTLTEETVTVTSHVGTLSAKASQIVSVWANAGSVTGLITLAPASVTLVTKSAKLANDRTTLTFLAADAVTSAKVQYIPAPTGLSALAAALATAIAS